MTDPLVYWAAQKDSKEFANSAIDRIKRYRDRLESSGRLGKMRRSLNAYYGNGVLGDKDASQMRQEGEQGELTSLNVNHFASLVQHSMVLITSSKPAFKAVAVNSDYSSGAQATMADALLEVYDKRLRMSDIDYEATHTSLITSEGYAFETWNAAAGDIYGVDPDTGKEVPEGDIEIETKTPFEVAFDPDLKSFEKKTWFAVERQDSRHDLAAKFPEVGDKILRCTQEMLWQEMGGNEVWESKPSATDPDIIRYWEVHHKPTPSLPNGRLVILISSDIVMFDSYDAQTDTDNGYPFDELHLYRIIPERQIGNVGGHTSFFDLLALQQGVDLVAMITSSAVNTGGLMNFWLPPGHNLSVTQLKGGMNLLESPVEPKAISTIKIDPAVIQFADFCVEAMRQRVAINDVVMGETQKGMPAQAMALLRAQAIEFQSRLQSNYERFVEQTRTGALKLLQKFAKSERVSILAGKSKTWARKEWAAGDLSDVERFEVEPLNAVARSFAGRMEMMKDLQASGALRRPEEYLNFMSTGRLDPVLEGPNANFMRLAKEKELMMQGVGPQPIDPMTGQPIPDGQPHILPLKTDTHWIDIAEAASVLAAPEARNNPAVVKAVIGYIEMHLALWTANPVLAQAMGGPIAPQDPRAMQPGMPPPGMAAPSGEQSSMGLPGSGGQSGAGPGDGPRSGPPAPMPQGAPQIRLPKPPENPLTGEQPPSPPVGQP